MKGFCFDLSNPKDQKRYFLLKAKKEIKKLKTFLEKKGFLAILVGKKNSGKGTYSKMLAEVIDREKIYHFSVGDMIREIDKKLKDEKKRKVFVEKLKKNYRGSLSIKEILEILEKRSTQTLLPTELILNLIKIEIKKIKGKRGLFIDGFPRDLEQLNFSLFLKDIISYQKFPDFFVLIDIPNLVIEERIKWRRICPLCQTSRNLKLLPTSKIGYDKEKKEFYLICDNPNCPGERMIRKEGDELGIEPIKERLEKDEKLIKKILNLRGIPKILLKNSLPLNEAKKIFEDYEITQEYYFELKGNKVKINQKPWIFSLKGEPYISLLPQPVVVCLIKKIVEVLNL